MFEFQCLDCYVNDINISEESGEDIENIDNFVVHMFGKTKEGESVTLNVTNYTPYIYIQYDDRFNNTFWHDALFEILQKYLVKWKIDDDEFTIVSDASSHLINGGIHNHMNVWGYNFEKKENFLKLYFKSLFAYKKLKYLLQSCHSNVLSSDEMQLFYNTTSEMDYASQYPYMKTYASDYLEKTGVIHKDCKGKNRKCKECLNKIQSKIGVLKFILKLGKKQLPFDFAKCKLYDVIDPILRFAHEKVIFQLTFCRI